MPSQLLRPCRQPGCGQLVPMGYCDRHRHLTCKTVYDQTRRKETPTLAESARLRSTVTWQKVRRIHRVEQPLCCDPFGDHPNEPRPNQNSHHIVPLAERPDLAFDLANLAATCTACHGKLEQMERAGTSTRHLFGVGEGTQPAKNAHPTPGPFF